ncbi:MAG: DNA mismatch repair endonuclease MutL [Spirochaetota bacterium]
MSETPRAGTPNVHVLPDQVSRKIAAGEVIDRPYSVVRELLDNALDAAAGQIEIHLEEGGTKSIRVVDDGVGMSREDLELCFLPHATSKISTEGDLEEVSSLGFRGEALSSIATVSRLRITSARDNSGSGNRLAVDAGKIISLGPAPANRGTAIEVTDLFYSLPARKRFLKRASAETKMAHSTLLEKALPFPETGFRLFTDGRMKQFLPPADRVDRVLAGYPDLGDRRLLHRIEGRGERFSFEVVTPGLEMVRRDRKRLQVYVNGRRVWEYGLVQAVEYAFSDYIPGGLYPSAFVFLEVDPREVDFNIHPAKREVRFRSIREIHSTLTKTLREFLKQDLGKRGREGRVPFSSPELFETAHGGPQANPAKHTGTWSVADAGRAPGSGAAANREAGTDRGAGNGPGGHSPQSAGAGREYLRGEPRGEARSQPAFDLTRRFEVPSVVPESVTYLGQAMRLFLVGENADGIYLVDQHAGHERVLYERLRSAPRVQHLLVPVEIETTDEEAELLSSRRTDLAEAGIHVAPRNNATTWVLTAIPAVEGLEAHAFAETLHELSALPEELERDFYADLACKAAIKDGDTVDPQTGEALMREIFHLETPHCPHGRPLWLELSRDQLFHLIGRSL